MQAEHSADAISTRTAHDALGNVSAAEVMAGKWNAGFPLVRFQTAVEEPKSQIQKVFWFYSSKKNPF